MKFRDKIGQKMNQKKVEIGAKMAKNYKKKKIKKIANIVAKFC